MVSKNIYVLVFFILPVQLLQAQKTSDVHTSKPLAPITEKLANSLLWEISGKDITKPSYLFGTMHLLCADDAKLTTADPVEKFPHAGERDRA